MDNKKIIKIHNKSDKPDNIVFRDNELIEKCIKVENKLPKFMKDYFIYLKGSVAISTRLAYLEDIHFFCNYLIEIILNFLIIFTAYLSVFYNK